MANDYFRFKQFIIYHDRCAMKVCTEACLLGAWFAAKMADASSILDIGSGSGLLMMMLAQRSKAVIHGIEIDMPAFEQAQDNIHKAIDDSGSSFFAQPVEVFPGDARTFSFPRKYDFIISNPPFYHNDLRAASDTANLARHSLSLDLEELIHTIDSALSPQGSFGVLLPVHRVSDLEQLAAGRFQLKEKLLVRQSPGHDHFRAIMHFDRNTASPSPAIQSELSIKTDHGDYSPDFTDLLRPYYLHL